MKKELFKMITVLHKMDDIVNQINQIHRWYNDGVISTRKANEWETMVRYWKHQKEKVNHT